MKKYMILVIICVSLLACSYSVFMNAFPHLRNIQITSFENNTSEYALAQELQNYLVNRFQNDGRLRISNLNPDSIIEGTILDYRNEIFGYDMFGNVTEYRVVILFSVQMIDLRMQEVMYENRSLMLSETYSPNSTNSEDMTTEAQAQNRVFGRLFDTVVGRTLDSW